VRCGAPLLLGEEPELVRLDRDLDLDRRHRPPASVTPLPASITPPPASVPPLPVPAGAGRAASRPVVRLPHAIAAPRPAARSLELTAEPEARPTRSPVVEHACAARAAPPPARPCAPEAVSAPSLEAAPVGLRACAWAVDAVLLSLAAAPPLVLAARAPPVGAGPGAVVPVAAAFLALLGFAYGVIGQALMGATPGKRLLGLRVAGPDGAPPGLARGALRAALAVVGTGVAGVGLLWAIFTRSGRSLHDLAADTVVVRAP
jgi:uncharacterized RDD family membrane protein YckC